PRSADDTALSCGKVGRRRPYNGSLSNQLGLFCFNAFTSPHKETQCLILSDFARVLEYILFSWQSKAFKNSKTFMLFFTK
ncbi:MAG: hypothetical protein IKU01_08790, partial [Bacteroidales bacterium]|nr:hypothetical protein [Bacteroidales bacterium]